MNREQKEKESLIFRKYTPISKIDTLGYVDLMIKIYKKDGDFPGGKFTSQLDKIQVKKSDRCLFFYDFFFLHLLQFY